MKRGNDHMSRQSGTDGELGGGFVADFSEDEDLGILAQEMPRRAGKIKADGFVDLCLHCAWYDLFHGILNSDDVASAHFSESAQTGVNGRCLSAARRAGE